MLHVTYFNTKNQWTATFASNQLIWIMPAFENKCIGPFKMPHNFKHNLTKRDGLIACDKQLTLLANSDTALL